MWMNAALSPFSLFDLLGHVDDGSADPTLAELGGRKQEDDRFPAESVRVVDLVLRVRRDPRRDLREVAADVGRGRRVDQRRPVRPTRGTRLKAPTITPGSSGRAQPVAFLDHRGDPPFAFAREVDFGRVDGGGGVRVSRGSSPLGRRAWSRGFRSSPGTARPPVLRAL